MRKGVCSIPHGHLDANVNYLTSTDEIDPLGGMSLYSGVPIDIEPAVSTGDSAMESTTRRREGKATEISS
jgi:hypothetical protein